MHISTTKGLLTSGAVASAALFAVVGVGLTPLTTHADTTSNYKQAFSVGNSSMSGIFDVAGDESGIDYTLAGTTSGSLECYGSNGSWVDIADLSGSGTVSQSDISSAATECNPNISTTAHLIQDMREGKIYFVSDGTQLPLASATISNVPPAITTSGTGGTATSTPVTGGGTSTSTPVTGTGSTSTSTATTTTAISASDLRDLLNNLLREHVSYSIDVLRNINDNSPALAASLAAQDQNAVSLSNAIGSVYGTAAGNQFLVLFRAHIADSNAYTMGVKDGSMTDQQTALANLDTELQGLSSFLATANPNIDYDTLLAALRQHEVLVNDASLSYNQGDYAGSYNYEEQALTQISGGADYLANAIATQYPTVFAQ